MDINLTEFELNLILNALAQRPFIEVADIISKLIAIRDSNAENNQ